MSQEDLACKAGCNPEVIEWIESGALLRPRNLIEIASVLKVNPAWLQFGEPWAHREPPKPGKT